MRQRKTIDVWRIQLRKYHRGRGIWYTRHEEYSQELAEAYKSVMVDERWRNRIVKRRVPIAQLNKYERLRAGVDHVTTDKKGG